MLPHWTHLGKEGERIPVVIYTNCDSVELFLMMYLWKVNNLIIQAL
ncbi:DUF4982 domain-containing protein [Parabacteroides massiliensis]